MGFLGWSESRLGFCSPLLQLRIKPLSLRCFSSSMRSQCGPAARTEQQRQKRQRGS